MSCPVYRSVQWTSHFHEVPEQHDHVYLVTLYFQAESLYSLNEDVLAAMEAANPVEDRDGKSFDVAPVVGNL